MEYEQVQDARLPVIGLGTWQLHGQECREAVAHALSIGYRHVDTARIYRNEAEVGRGLRDSGVERDQVWLTSKVPGTDGDRDGVEAAVEASLRDLDVDHLDLLLLHQPGPHPIAATMEAFRAEQEAGHVRYLGVSNFDADQASRALAEAPIVTVQNEHHVHRPDDAVRQWCQEHDVVLTAYSPLGKGSEVDHDTLADIAARHGATAAQVALRWVVQQDRVVAVPRSSDPRHREQNLDVFGFELDDEDLARLQPDA